MAEPAVDARPLTAAQLEQPLIELPLPSPEMYGDLQALVAVPDGYAVLYPKSIGQGKTAAGWEHRVFTSSGGLHWTLASMPSAPTWVYYDALAYGAGRYLLAGQSGNSSQVALATSQDASAWREQPSELPAILTLAYLNDRFFALALGRGIFSAVDAVHFSGGLTDAVQLSAIAYGAGVYVAVGSGPIERSPDGLHWSAITLDCGLPGACVTPPTGPPVQGFHSQVWFVDGNFYTGTLISPDGQHWRAIADPDRVPDGYAGGWLLRRQGQQLTAWRHDAAALSTSITTDNPDQLDCRAHRCVMLAGALLLIP